MDSRSRGDSSCIGVASSCSGSGGDHCQLENAGQTAQLAGKAEESRRTWESEQERERRSWEDAQEQSLDLRQRKDIPYQELARYVIELRDIAKRKSPEALEDLNRFIEEWHEDALQPIKAVVELYGSPEVQYSFGFLHGAYVQHHVALSDWKMILDSPGPRTQEYREALDEFRDSRSELVDACGDLLEKLAADLRQ